VSVRNEGVMEKCTFCVQRIRRSDLDAKVNKTPTKDGNLRPACVQACAAGCLVFGDLNDPKSAVNKIIKRESARTYRIGAIEYHTAPNVIYLRPQKNAEALGAL